MDNFYEILKLWHILSFVFMSIPLFNLIVVNERALMGASFNFGADIYMENIIRHGALSLLCFSIFCTNFGNFLAYIRSVGHTVNIFRSNTYN